MNAAKLVTLTVTIPLLIRNRAPRLSRRQLLLAGALLPLLIALLVLLRQSDSLTDLEAARAQWQATGITDYRIVVEFKRPYSSCQQDFEVRGTEIGDKHKDSCSIGGAITGKATSNWPTIANLFIQIENGHQNPQCGSNGCVCDGPIEMTVTYDPQRGYPQQIIYTLRPDLRTRDLQYWLALLDGSLANCPPVPFIGQTIRVTLLEALPPLVEQLADPTPQIGIGDAVKPETTPSP